MVNKLIRLLLFSVSSLFFISSLAQATSNSLTYQGRIVRSDGSPLEYQNTSFLFKITDPSGQCVIYQEYATGIDMTNSKGVFDVPIGTGNVSWPTGGTFSILDSFNNGSTFNCGSCSGYTCVSSGGTYSAVNADARLLRVQFHDGNSWKAISPDNVIRSVPYAAYSLAAQKLGNYDANAFILKNSVNGNVTCDSGSFLTWNATTKSFGCAGVSGSAGGTVTDVTVASPLAVTNGQSTPHITIQAASSSQHGYLTSTDWTTFNNKLGSTTNFGGDVSGTAANISVDKIKNAAVSFSSLSSGDFLKYSGGNWINSTIAVSDIANLSTNLAGKPDYSQFPTSCTAAQTMTFISPVGGFTCTTIAIPGTQVSGNIAGNAAGFSGSLGGDVTGTQSSTTVTKIRNVTVSATAPSPGDVLKYDNGTSSWVPSPDTASTATSANTASTIVSRDASGNFAAGTITANLTGNVTGNLTGNVTGNVTGSASLNVLKAGDSMSGNLTHAANTGNIYTAGTGAGTVTLQGPTNAIGSNYTLRLPTSQSSGTQALVNDGSGNLAWQSLSSGSVTSVSATSPLSSSGGTTPTISLGGLSGLGTGNQILGMNNGASGYEYKTLNGTTNQVTVGHGAGSITLSTPQNIHTGASPTFAGMTLSSLNSAGLVKNDGSGVLSGGNKASLTTDVSGVLPTANGGTGASSFSNNRVIASDGSGNLTSVAAGTNNAVLQHSASGPVWSTATYPATTTVNQLLYSSAGNTVAGLATANNAVLTTNGSGVPSFQAASGDLFNQYALLAGRAGGQTIYGGTAASETLTLNSTSNSTRGNIILNPNGGNVGIGTATPLNALEVFGSIATSSGTYFSRHYQDVVPNGANYHGTRFRGTPQAPAAVLANDVLTGLYGAGATGPTTESVWTGAIRILAAENYSPSTGGSKIDFATTPLGGTTRSTRMTIDPAGNVGIGTTNPIAPLHLFSTGGAILDRVGINASHLTMRSARGTEAAPTAVLNGEMIGQITFAGHDGTDWALSGSRITGRATENWNTTSHGSSLSFATTTAGTLSSLDRMTIDSNGRVGIGTANPSTPLEVVGSIVANNGNFTTFHYNDVTANGANFHGMRFRGSPGASTAVLNGDALTGIYGGGAVSSSDISPWVGAIRVLAAENFTSTANGTRIDFGTTPLGGVSRAIRMTISPSGSVGIGTTNPSYALHVVGDTYTSGYFRSPNGTIQTSDARFKDNVQPIENALEKILNVRGVTYDWKRAKFPEQKFSDKHQMGVIAQEVEASFPEAVITDENGYKAVNYSSLVAPLISAVKELYAKLLSHENLISQKIDKNDFDAAIQARDQEILNLKKKNTELEERLSKIEKTLSAK